MTVLFYSKSIIYALDKSLQAYRVIIVFVSHVDQAE